MNNPIFLATTGRGVVRAAFKDEWTVEPLLTDQYVRCLAADPHHPHTVYVGTQGEGVICLNAGEKSWFPAGLSRMVVKSLAVSALEPNTIYAGTRPAALWVSRDGGANWQELEALRHVPGRRWWFSPERLPFRAYVQAIALSPTDPQHIIIGIESGAVLQSHDGGQSWSKHRTGALRDCHSLTFHASDSNWVYEAGGTGKGVSFSSDGGESWTQPNDGLDRHYGWACAADPEQPDIWYASLAPGAFKAHSENGARAYIFRSKNGGAWQKLSGGLPQPFTNMPYALLTDPAAPGHIYAGLSSGVVWHSSDYGDSWTQMPFHLGGINRALIILPTIVAG